MVFYETTCVNNLSIIAVETVPRVGLLQYLAAGLTTGQAWAVLGEDALGHVLKKPGTPLLVELPDPRAGEGLLHDSGQLRNRGRIGRQIGSFLEPERTIGAAFHLRHEMAVVPEYAADYLVTTAAH